MNNSEKHNPPNIGFIVSNYRLILLMFAVLSVGFIWQAKKFEIDASADTLLAQGNEIYIRSRVVNDRFAPQEFLLVGYKPKEHAVLSEQTFADLRSIGRAINALPRVESVRSLVNVPLLSLAESGVSSSTDPSEFTIEKQGYDIAKLKKVFDKHPIFDDLLINKDGTATAIQVLFKADPEISSLDKKILEIEKQQLNGELNQQQQDEIEALKEKLEPLQQALDSKRIEEIAEIRNIVKGFESDADIFLGGVHVIGYQLIEIIQNDLLVFGSAIAAMICIVLLLFFRGVRWVIIPILCCAVSVSMALGMIATAGLKATVISSNFVAIQLILTLAIVIHLIVQYRETCVQQGKWQQRELVQSTLNEKIAPCFYAGLTTSVGFASLVFSGIQPVISFGWMMILAMACSLAVSLLLFPALLMLFKRESLPEARGLPQRILNLCRRLSIGSPRFVMVSSLALLLVAIVGATRLDVENSFLNYFAKDTKVHQELAFIDQELGGSTPLDISYTIPKEDRDPNLIITAEVAQRMQRVQAVLEEKAAMGKVLSIVNFTELAKNINHGKPVTEYELTAVYWTMEDAVKEDLVGSFFSEEHQQLRMSARIVDTTEGLDRAEFMAELQRDIEAQGVKPDDYQLTSLFVLYQDILQRLFDSQIKTLGLVMVALFLAFLIIFKSFKIACIAMVPNILSTSVVFGVMGWLAIPLDLMTITIAAIAMGIAVDDTIHYIHRYLVQSEHNSAQQAVHNSHDSVGFAVLYTTVIIMLGFSLLGFSDFVPSVLFGLLTSLAMLMALLSDLILLPALLVRFQDGNGKNNEALPKG